MGNVNLYAQLLGSNVPMDTGK